MRYQNWDVILFPGGAKAPLQEFRTGCYVIPDPDSTQVPTGTPLGLPSRIINHPKTPTVACFIPNLQPGYPFRISLHNWQPPEASTTVQSSATPDSEVCFEIRVLIDGICVANLLLGQQPAWPQVLETTSQFDEGGNPELLRFPPFHPEFLTQNWWNPGQNFGRIRVIISEGLFHAKRIPLFERLKNIVSFSFQHAPKDVLETAGIAWPNPGMWAPAPPRRQSVISPPPKPNASDPDAQRHSPQSQVIIIDDSPIPHRVGMMAPLGASQAYSGPSGNPRVFSAPPEPVQPGSSPQALCNPGPQLDDPSWLSLPPMLDPFIDDSKSQRQIIRTGHGSSEDLFMPVCSRSPTPSNNHVVARSDAPQITFHGEVAPVTAQSQFEEMMGLFINDGDEGFAPVNLSVDRTAHTPNRCLDSSASAEPIIFSFCDEQPRAVPVTTRDPPPREIRETSDVGMNLGLPENLEPIEQSVKKVKRNPALIIRSKKEGRASARKSTAPAPADGCKKEDRKWSQGTSIVDSEAKRTRSGRYPALTSFRELSSSSPTHKVSRNGRKEDLHGHDVTEKILKNDADRAPLTELNNPH